MAKRDPATQARAQHLLGLFAYHHDAPLVARALGVSMSELVAELELLNIRRRAFALTRRTDRQLPLAVPRPGPGGPPVRRRTRAAPPPAPALSEAAALKALLAELGPHRAALAARLELSE